MKVLRARPIRTSLLLVFVGSIVFSFVLVVAGIWTYELTTYRDRLIRRVHETASFIAANSAPTLAFKDSKTAHEILTTVGALPSIKAAALYSADGKLLASVAHPREAVLATHSLTTSESSRFTARYLELETPVSQKGVLLGTLLTNAMKFGAHKPIEIRLSQDGTLARLSVQDHGIGISKESQSKIFRRFERAVSMNEYGGLGLGLFIVGQIMHAHGGAIQVQSEPGQGARFTVELPLNESQIQPELASV
jgi:light-regulated signal transduction histidine kinase (bacteriophytochrome)